MVEKFTERVNNIAYELATMEDKQSYSYQVKWSDLYDLIHKKVVARCEGLYRHYSVECKLNIEKEAFEEIGLTAKLKAVNDYDITKGDFMARLNLIIDQQTKTLVRDAQSNKRLAMTYCSTSLDAPTIHAKDDDLCLMDTLEDESADTEVLVINKQNSLLKVLKKWSLISKKTLRDSRLIYINMIVMDKDAKRDALCKITAKNWVTTRKALSRANQNFVKYLSENQIEIAG